MTNDVNDKSSTIIRFLLLPLLLTLTASLQSDLKCEFGFETFGSLFGRVYYCHALLDNVHESSLTITSISGQHSSDKSNEDVEAFLSYRRVIKSVPEGLDDFFPNLKILVIDNASLQHFENIKRLYNLKYISLQYNEIEILNIDSFNGLNKLEKIVFEGNKIRKLHPGTFNGLPNLTQLSLSKNLLRNLEPDLFRNNLKLEELEFYQNKLTQIDGDVFRRLTSLTELSLTSNKCIDSSYPSIVSSLSELLEEIDEKCGNSCFAVRKQLEEAQRRIEELENN